MKLKIEIEFGNDMMLRYLDAVCAFRQSLENALGERRITGKRPKVGDGAKIRDYNGNTVGQWEVVADGE